MRLPQQCSWYILLYSCCIYNATISFFIFFSCFIQSRIFIVKVSKVGRLFRQKLDFEDIKFWFKIKDIDKTKRKNSVRISVFGYEYSAKYPIEALKKCFEEKHIDVLLIVQGGKRHYVLMKDIYSCMITQYIAEEKFLLLLFTRFYYRKNIEIPC